MVNKKISQMTIEEIQRHVEVFCKKIFPNANNTPMIELMMNYMIDSLQKEGRIWGLSYAEYQTNMKRRIFEQFYIITHNEQIYLNEMFEPKA